MARYQYQNSKTIDVAFYRMPMSTLSTRDFSGPAKVFAKSQDVISGSGTSSVDLLIQSVQYAITEQVQDSNHQGNTFGLLYFGAAPIQMNVSAYLPDTDGNLGKRSLVAMYRNYLRLTAVANRQTMPCLFVKSCYFYGPWISLRISEAARTEDLLTLVFTILVTKFMMYGDGKEITFDYTNGGQLTVSDENTDTMDATGVDPETTVNSGSKTAL